MTHYPRQSLVQDQAYFSKWIEFKETRIPKSVAIAQRPGPYPDPKYHAQYIFQIFINRFELLIERYSHGDDLTDLRSLLPGIVDTWEWSLSEELKVFTPEEMATRKGFAVNFDYYVVCLWMISIAICLEADDELLKRMLAVIGNEGEDLIFERLVATRIPGRRAATNAAQIRSYGELVVLTSEPHSPTTGLRLKRFVEHWYEWMKPAYWHDCHLGKDGGGYFGYWCFEAAAVVKAFKLDDSEVRNNPYYPKDMAAFKA